MWSFLQFTGEHGIGVRSDSVAYIWAARSLASGEGIGRPDGEGNFKPITHWPPFYPILLAGFEKVGIGAIEGARRLGAALFGVNILLVGWILKRLTQSFWFSLAGTFLFTFAPGILETSLMAMTEPLYITLSLIGLIGLELYLQEFKKGWLIAAAVVCGLAFLTRYVGLAILGTGVLVLLIFSPRTFRQKIKDAVIFGVLSVIPMSVWVVRNMIVAGSTTNRHFSFIPISQTDWNLTGETISGWLEPAGTVFNVGEGKLILTLAVVVFMIFFLWPQKDVAPSPNGSTMGWLLGICTLGYAGMVYVSRAFFDPAITIFEQRILAPIFLGLLILLIGGLAQIWRRLKKRSLLGASILAIVLVWGGYTFGYLYQNQWEIFGNHFRTSGGGYADVTLSASDLVKTIRQLPEDAIIFTTNVEEFYYFSGRSGYGYAIGEMRTGMDQWVNEIITRKPVVLVNFYRSEELETEIAARLAGMRILYEDPEAIVYGMH